jgi:hypothetical protein
LDPWLARNEKIFKNQSIRLDQYKNKCIDLIKEY